MRTRHTRKLISAGLGLIVLACAWLYFAPTSLDGSTSYVVTDGISMEPRFHGGDLVLVRSQSHYGIGEIVAYRSRAFHTIVLHRIVGRAGARYVFKGDNNNFVDFEHPAGSQLIGSLWLHIPGAGAQLRSLRSPLLIAVLVGMGTLLFAGAAFVQRKRRRRRARRADGAQAQSGLTPQRLARPTGGVLALGAVAVLPFLALAVLASTRPASALLPVSVPYRQSGTFSYAANSASGPIYPGNRAVTGDPLFTHVISTVELRFGYRFGSAARHSLGGKIALYATLASSSGWQTKLQLGRPRSFRGDHVDVRATLNLGSLLALVRHVEATTSVSGSYTLTLLPHLNASGSLDGLPLHASFSPQLKFALNQLEVQPILTGGSTPSAGQSAATPFAPSAIGSATARRYQPSLLSLGPLRLSVQAARWIALGGTAILLLALLALHTFLRRRHREESEVIRARYGRLIVPVERVWHLPELAVIDVADIEALVRIAEHYDRSILHEETDEGEAFWVTDESGQFRYAVSSTWAAGGETHEQEPMERPLSDIYAERLEPAPVVSAFDARAAGASIAAYAAAEEPWIADDPTIVLPREGWHAGYEAAETYAGSRAKNLP
jgi:signal peptidase I